MYFVSIKNVFFWGGGGGGWEEGYNIRMLEITLDNCCKCDLEKINDPKNSQYFLINRRDFDIETKRNWQAIFDKYKDLSTQKYRTELTPNITFQSNRIFVRNNLIIIKSCKATNLEFLKLKEKLGLCLYEDICDKKEFIFMSEESFIQQDIKNKLLRKEKENEKVETRNQKVETRNEKVESRKEKNEKLKMENEQLRKNNVDVKIKESIEKPIEIKSFEEDKNKFKEILAIIDSNKFNCRNKIGEFEYIDIKDSVNNIRNNTISERDAKKDLTTLNKIKNAEIEFKILTPKHKDLLNLFNDLLNIILTDKTLES